jgi:tryptophanyl-tRNA synthetase
MSKVFSGIQATGAKQLGNYIGAMRQYVATQDEGEAFFCIVDLHSITADYDPQDLHDRTLDLAALLYAVGLDPDRCTLFLQSHVTAHAESAWLLSAVTGFGQLGRMTQFKEKGEGKEFVSAGLFTYPVLMAGDILLYQTDIVPVGDDQRQHVELARDIAQRFNARYGETFTIPRGVFPQVGARIMDLQEPTKKMSTSAGTPQGTVLILDDPDTIRKKFKTAVTDSNLIEILSVASGTSIPEVEAAYDGRGYGDLKGDVGEAVVTLFAPVKERYAELRADEGELRRLLSVGAEKARETAEPTLKSMYERMGFVLR